jgi:hypothetical protein
MPKTPTVIGHIACPLCPPGSPDADVRLDKNGDPYIYCATGCYVQVFTREPHRADLLRARMKPIAAAAAATSAPAPALAPISDVAPTSTPTSQPAKRTWLTTLLDTGPAK